MGFGPVRATTFAIKKTFIAPEQLRFKVAKATKAGGVWGFGFSVSGGSGRELEVLGLGIRFRV